MPHPLLIQMAVQNKEKSWCSQRHGGSHEAGWENVLDLAFYVLGFREGEWVSSALGGGVGKELYDTLPWSVWWQFVGSFDYPLLWTLMGQQNMELEILNQQWFTSTAKPESINAEAEQSQLVWRVRTSSKWLYIQGFRLTLVACVGFSVQLAHWHPDFHSKNINRALINAGIIRQKLEPYPTAWVQCSKHQQVGPLQVKGMGKVDDLGPGSAAGCLSGWLA